MKKMLRSVAMPSSIDMTVKSVISTLRAEVFDEIKSLEQYEIEAEISQMQSDITALEGLVSDIQEDVTTLSGAVSALDGRVTDVEEELAQVDITEIAAFLSLFINKCVDANSDYLSDANGDICMYQRL